MSSSVLLESCCPDRSRLCDRCRADAFAHSRGVAACRGEVWAMSLVGRIPRDQRWQADSEKVALIARMKVDDLARDPVLLEQLAAELAHWAARWWSSNRADLARM